MQSSEKRSFIEISLDKKIPILNSNIKRIEQGATFGSVAGFFTLDKMGPIIC